MKEYLGPKIDLIYLEQSDVILGSNNADVTGNDMDWATNIGGGFYGN